MIGFLQQYLEHCIGETAKELIPVYCLKCNIEFWPGACFQISWTGKLLREIKAILVTGFGGL
jgi:hypothetical protein